MGKNFKQALSDLDSGLAQINNKIASSTDRRIFEKALKNKDIQEARIDFFKRGYHLAYKEIHNQEKLDFTLKPFNKENI